jgi:hyperosmotically inducible protein
MDPRKLVFPMLICAASLLAAGCDANSSGQAAEAAVGADDDSPPRAGKPKHADGAISAPEAESAQDARLSAQVEAAIGAEPELRGASIAIRTEAGVVTLSGTAPHPELRSLAAQVALSVEGVKHVRNELQISQQA